MLDPQHLLWTQIAAGVCLLIFGGQLFNLFRMRSQMRAAESWSKVEGVITVSKVDQPPAHVSDDLNDASPIIRYRYRAGGQDLESDRIIPGGQPLTTRLLAGQQVARYPVGARVDVYVDPADSKNVLLEPGAKNNLVGLLAFAVVFGLIAAVLTAHALAGKVLYTSKGVPMFAFAFPALAILGAILSFVAFVRGLRLARASARWPTAAGTVTTADVIEEVTEDTSNDDKSSIRKKIYRYQLDLRYAYQVGKRDFVGTAENWGWTGIYGLREVAEKAAGRYTPGQPVHVYYDPAQPGNAVLEPGSRKGSLAPLVFSLIAAGIGSIMLAVFINVGFGG
jgi:Protein of unknown function (DUF3592)